MSAVFPQILIETIVRKAIRDIRDSPKRSTRNLIDMALNFSEGRFQSRFFETAQSMLRDENSAYYRLIPDMVVNVDTEKIIHFGINLGYNSCTAGAKKIGALVGATALIPIAGAYIGAGVGAILILTVSPMEALLFLVFIVVLQQLEGNIVYPRVVGSQLGLPALWVLAAITVGGNVMGIGGMLLAVPLTTAIYRLVRENMRKRELAKGEVADAEEAPETAPQKAEAPRKPFAARKKK